ncbi:MAG: (Fe-S)-binding protein [archaeon]
MAFFDFMRGVKNAIKKENILYYPGCMTKFNHPKIFSNYKSLLSDLGINFRLIDELVCCGSPLLSAGYTDDFEDKKKKNLSILKQEGITKIITNCPHCLHIFKNQYGFRVEHISQTLRAVAHKVKPGAREEVSYHDPCLLTRRDGAVINEPRAILKQANFSVIEPALSKESTFCCGAGGGLRQINPLLAGKIGARRLGQFRTNKVVVSCPFCYAHLKECAANSSKEIVELSETIFDG